MCWLLTVRRDSAGRQGHVGKFHEWESERFTDRITTLKYLSEVMMSVRVSCGGIQHVLILG